ncbi:hypothetical protein GCM10022215_13700 [Nocardioides fonticola]|uniref:Uncharacterized protein n=1 Tax=Nocardioides fonticola TaxID=450363 RepID=A0ABP7XGE6_9ACTN
MLAADAGDELGDGVLDLEAGVHLQEVRLTRLDVEEELHGAGVDVADLPGQRDARLAHQRAHRGVEVGRRRLLEHLLMAPLTGAVALAEMHHVPVGVGEHLHLDVPAALDVLLDQQGAVAEGALGLAAGRDHRLLVLLGGPHDAHALAAAAGGRLHEHRERRRDAVAVASRDDGHARGLGDLAGGVLAAHALDDLGARADEGQPRCRDGRRERRPLGEEAVARVHRVGARGHGGRDDGLDVEVALHAHGGVGLPHVRGAGVEVGVDRDGADAHRGGGAHDADRDLAAVGDEEGLHLGSHHMRKTP